MAKREKKKAIAVKVPQSRDEASNFVHMIGVHQRERERLEAAMNDRLAKTKANYEETAKPHAEAIVQLMRGLEIWAAANRDALTEGGKTKTARLATGELRWRMTPPAVALKSVKDVLAALVEKGLGRFIRRKDEVNKEAILEEPDAVKEIAGIVIGQHEEFVIVPFETKLEEVA